MKNANKHLCLEVAIYGEQHLTTDKCKKTKKQSASLHGIILDTTSLHGIHFGRYIITWHYFGHYIITWHSFWTLHSQLWHTPPSSFVASRGSSPADQHIFKCSFCIVILKNSQRGN